MSLVLRFGTLFSLLLTSPIWSMSSGAPEKNPFEGKESWSLAQYKSQNPESVENKIYFVSNREGTTGPCGCSVNPKGGLDRSQNFAKIENLKEQLVFNTGNAFFPSAIYMLKDEKELKKNAVEISKAYQNMGFDAHNVGELDLSMGPAFIKELSTKYALPLLSANLTDPAGRNLFTKSIKFSQGKLKLLVTGLSSFNQLQREDVVVQDPVKTFAELVKGIEKDTVLIVLSDLPSLLHQELAKLYSGPMVILGAKEIGSLEIPERLSAHALFWQIQNRGQQWGVLRWSNVLSGQSWYSSQKAQEFSDRWKQLLNDRKRILSMSSSSDQKRETDIIDAKLKQLVQFAPDEKYTNNIFYEYRLVEMDEAYSGEIKSL